MSREWTVPGLMLVYGVLMAGGAAAIVAVLGMLADLGAWL